MDITHVHHPFVSGSLAMRYCVPRNIPIVFTNHTRYDLLTQAYIPILPETIGDAALKAYLSPFYRACDLVIVPSPSMRQVLEDAFWLRFTCRCDSKWVGSDPISSKYPTC